MTCQCSRTRCPGRPSSRRRNRARSRCESDRDAMFAPGSSPTRGRPTTPAATHLADRAPSFFVRLYTSSPRLRHNGRPSRIFRSPSAVPPVLLAYTTLAFCRPHASRQSTSRAVSVPVPAACYLASALLISIVRSATVYQYTESVSKRRSISFPRTYTRV